MTLFGSTVFADVMKLRLLRWEGLPGLSEGDPEAKVKHPHDTRRDNRQKDSVPRVAETRAVQLQVTECQQPPEAGGGEDQILSVSLQSQHLDARLFLNSKKINVCCF